MAHDPSRRRFLGGALGLLAAAGLGWRLGMRNDVPPPVAAPGTTTGEPPPTTSSTTAPNSTAGTPPDTAPPATAAEVTTTSQPRSRRVEALCRDAWRAHPPTGDFVEHHIERITIHHTAIVLASASDAPAKAHDHQRYHQSLGWPDLAYHYLIDLDGNVYEGRPVTAVGDTATEYDPTGHLLVCLEGNYEEQEPAPPQLDVLAALLAWASSEFGVAPETIGGHRNWAATSCPGVNLARLIDDGSLAAVVRELARSGGVDLVTVCGPEATTRVAAIEAGAG